MEEDDISKDNADNSQSKERSEVAFKKPILVGKIGRFPRKIINKKKDTEDNDNENQESLNETIEGASLNEPIEDNVEVKLMKGPAQQLIENQMPLPYKEPPWSGLPQTNGNEYVFEVLKSGTIVERINLMPKPFWAFGRSTNCEIYMAHPTVSRFHAVLQYRREGSENEPPGFYIYDLNSTHGTFLNKGKLKPRVYAPVKVGHMIKLGFSTRSYVLTGPDEDTEEESQFTITELKQQRLEKIQQKELAEKEALAKQEKEREEKRKRDVERGVDWGLGEDAEEDTDLTENPFAQTNNEELYIDDPKKALRGFMEREGHTFEYDCSEQGIGQFLCRVQLPLDDDRGCPIFAEVLHKGKKKEAVVQCALEACKILDRYGVLRQATHESRKRKPKNWEENDYYDSDEDTFLDRTGSIEKKRQKRMQAKVAQQPETYQSLLEKEKNISLKISSIEKQLNEAKAKNLPKTSDTGEDPLDSYMSELKESKLDKQTVSKLKSELVSLKADHANIVKLANLAKPADLPPLVISTKSSNETQSAGTSKAKAFPIYGKRSKIKVRSKPTAQEAQVNSEQSENEEEEENSEKNDTNSPKSNSNNGQSELSTSNAESNINKSEPTVADKKDVPYHIKMHQKLMELESIITENNFPNIMKNHITDIKDVLQNIKDLSAYKGRIDTDKRMIMARNRKVQKHIHNLIENYDSHNLLRISKELQRIFHEIQDIVEKEHMVYAKIRILGVKIELVCSEMFKEVRRLAEKEKKGLSSTSASSKQFNKASLQLEDEHDTKVTEEELEKRKKRNQRRIQLRKEKAEIEKQRGYQEDARKEDYNMWLPPDNQTGDGKTSLNDKYGY